MKIRFYRELWDHPSTRYPAIYGNDVVEREAYAVLAHPGEDLPGFDGARMALGQIKPFERYLRVVYVPEPDTNSTFVLTAMTLRGVVLRACRARQRSRGRHHRGERQRVQIYEHGSATRPWQDPEAPPAAEQRFPPGWDEERVRRVIDHYLQQLPEEQVAEDEAVARAGRDQKPQGGSRPRLSPPEGPCAVIHREPALGPSMRATGPHRRSTRRTPTNKRSREDREMRLLTAEEKPFLDVFLHEAATPPFTGPATKALHNMGIEYGDISYIAWAYEQDTPRTGFAVGHAADVAPPLPWPDRQSALRRDHELRQIWQQRQQKGRGPLGPSTWERTGDIGDVRAEPGVSADRPRE